MDKKVTPKEKVELVERYKNGEVSQRRAAALAQVHPKSFQNWVRIYETEGVDGFIKGKNKHYSAALKEKAVKDYLSGKGSIDRISKKYKIHSSDRVMAWVKEYNAHGGFRLQGTGGSYMRETRSITQAEKVKIARECVESGKDYAGIALKYQISYQQVRSWTMRYIEMGEAGLEDRRGRRKKDQEARTELEKAKIEIEQLKHKLYLAEMERDLLKKLDEIEGREAYRK